MSTRHVSHDRGSACTPLLIICHPSFLLYNTVSVKKEHRPAEICAVNISDMETPIVTDLEKISCQRYDRFQPNLRSIMRRLLATCVAITLLVICVFVFSTMGDLRKRDQRGFNALAILLTGTMSLCIGSLFGYLGSMIRWPLLARAAHKAADVFAIIFICSVPLINRLLGRRNSSDGIAHWNVPAVNPKRPPEEMDANYFNCSSICFCQYCRPAQCCNLWIDI